MAHFFVYPFASDASNRAALPDTGSNPGSVSYEYGWTSYYQLNINTDPLALPMSRTQTNQLMFDITEAIQQYQTHGVPDWITAAENLGVDYVYDIFARVRYNDQIWENQVAANATTPSVANGWTVVSGGGTVVPTGTIIDYAGSVVPGSIIPAGYLPCDGNPVSRATYVDLLGILTFTQNATFSIGTPNVSGLTNATTLMYVGMPVESANVPAGTTVLTITDANNIVLSANATIDGAADATFFPWGNGDGSTTFETPALNRSVTVGSGGTASTVLGKVTGQSGGAEDYTMVADDLPVHTHAAPTVSWNTAQNFSNVPAGQFPIHNDQDSTVTFNPAVTATGNNTTTNQPVSLMQPSVVVNKIIKT